MSESRYEKVASEQIVAVRFRMKAQFDEVVVRLLEAALGTGFSLLKIMGDGERVYPFGGRNAARTASSWRAELSWHAPTLMSGWRLEVFMKRAELFLGLPGGVRLELGGGHRNPRDGVRGLRRARLFGTADEVGTLLDPQS